MDDHEYFLFEMGFFWDRNIKGYRPRSGWHPKTEESNSFLMLGKLGLFINADWI